jgi:hypothetical protein
LTSTSKLSVRCTRQDSHRAPQQHLLLRSDHTKHEHAPTNSICALGHGLGHVYPPLQPSPQLICGDFLTPCRPTCTIEGHIDQKLAPRHKRTYSHSTLLQGFLQLRKGEITAISLLLEHLIIGGDVLEVALQMPPSQLRWSPSGETNKSKK